MRKINPFSKSGTLAAGASVPFQPRGYFALLEGSGLVYAERGGESRFSTLPLRTPHGDGQPNPPLIVKNPTGAPVDYELYTADIPFDPKLDGVTQSVTIVDQVDAIAIEGAAALHALASMREGSTAFAATGIAAVIAAPGAATRLRVYELTLTNLDTAAATVLIYSAATLKRTIRVPAGDTRTIAFPAGLLLGVNESLSANIGAAPVANPIHVAATAAAEV